MNGLIAYFDILGYQSFLDNNPNAASATADKVLNLVTTLPEDTRAFVSRNIVETIPDENVRVSATDVFNSLTHLIFSDTILLTLQYPDNASDEWKSNAIVLLRAISSHLCASMFLSGLPLRGALMEGEFVRRDYCFAGRAIIDAYKLAQSLNLSGCVFGAEISNRATEALGVKDGTLVSYLTPLRAFKEQKMYHLNWLEFIRAPGELDIVLSDIEKFVLRSFWAHNKDCPQDVDVKIANTSKLIRRLAIALEAKTDKSAKDI